MFHNQQCCLLLTRLFYSDTVSFIAIVKTLNPVFYFMISPSNCTYSSALTGGSLLLQHYKCSWCYAEN